ncbi:MAG: F0F1 ATP synthase subunit B' [Alphaproteobacteria bacterium]|nr:F0F1 ATP synthase subunit B' [Alphaproteobacteria bacterium]
MPQFDPTWVASQLVWLAIAFGVLYLALTRIALPRIAEVLENRHTRISADLEKAGQLKDEAAQVLAAYEKTLAEARGRAQALIRTTSDEMAAAAAGREADTARRLADQTKAAEARIAEAKQAALANLRTVAVDVASAAVERLIGTGVASGQIDAAVGAAIKDRS